jgi:hypothetical protein
MRKGVPQPNVLNDERVAFNRPSKLGLSVESPAYRCDFVTEKLVHKDLTIS